MDHQLFSLQDQTDLLEAMHNLLSQKSRPGQIVLEGAKFEVHYSGNWFDQSGVTARSKSLLKALDRARAQVEAQKSSRSWNPPTVFVAYSEYIVPIEPEDAVEVAAAEGRQMTKDMFGSIARLCQPVGKFVWRQKDELPGWHSSRKKKKKSISSRERLRVRLLC